MKGTFIHKKDLYKFMESQPSGFETTCSGDAPFVLEALLLELAAFLGRFLTAAWVELVFRLTPEVVEADLPLVAGDMKFRLFNSEILKGGAFLRFKTSRTIEPRALLRELEKWCFAKRGG